MYLHAFRAAILLASRQMLIGFTEFVTGKRLLHGYIVDWVIRIRRDGKQHKMLGIGYLLHISGKDVTFVTEKLGKKLSASKKRDN